MVSDLPEGVIDDVAFRLADAHFAGRRARSRSRWQKDDGVPYPVFLVKSHQFTFQKPFAGCPQVREWGSPDGQSQVFQSQTRIGFDFNKKFSTFATDELSASLRLDARLHADESSNSKNATKASISMSFTANLLSIAIQNNKSLFETQAVPSGRARSCLESIQRDIDLAKELIRLPKLNSTLFLQK
ncbi:MAG: DUF3137 domain-containing protein [Bacillus subtilis]|nr:DUF3137 domain-containing protein [Bacillus subtilis]